MKNEPTWRQLAAPIIAKVLSQYPEDCPERRKALREAYPFGPRAHWPYKAWLAEVAHQTGRRKPKAGNVPNGGLTLPGLGR